MAPTKPDTSGAPLETSIHTGSILADFKSSITYTKNKLRALRSKDSARVNKPALSHKPIFERENLKQALERLSSNANSSGSASAATDTVKAQFDDHKSNMFSYPSVSAKDFEIGGRLGHGKYGRVYLARHLATNYVCALKVISKAQCATEGEEGLIRRELETHQNLVHKNILKFIAWFHDDRSMYLVLEFAPGGSLYSRLKKQPKFRFDERTTAQYIAQTAEALRYMHSKNIMHRDIKPENILLGLYDEIKLADFGYSVHTTSGSRSTICGTLDYLSPEVALMMLKPGKSPEFYTKAIDLWSLGVLMYELLVGRPPFERKNGAATRKKIANFKGNGLKFPGHVSLPAEELIQQMLNFDAEQRLSLDDVLAHPWIVHHVGNPAQTGGHVAHRKSDANIEEI
ncbi:spindle assembly checkpoint kinase [Coniothyrium glycines]